MARSARALLLLAFLVAVAAPALALAQQAEDPAHDLGLLALRAGGVLRIASDEEVGTAVGLGDDVRVEGLVRDNILVVGADVVIDGRVEGRVLVIRGNAILNDGALVSGDVLLFQGELEQSPTATVAGSVRRQGSVFELGWTSTVFGFLLWLSVSVLVLACGLAFAAIGGRQLYETATVLTARATGSLVALVALWIGGAALSVVAFLTVVGIPVAFAILGVVLPALWLLGYLVAGTWLGKVILAAMNHPVDVQHPYLAAFTGIFGLQAVAFLPGLGVVLAALAGFWGTGAIAYAAWRAMRAGPPPSS